MKTEDLIALGLSEDVANQVFALHGKDITSHKTQVATLQSEADALKTQLTEAGSAIESFKAMKPDELKAAAAEYKTKFEQAQQEYSQQLATVKFDHALESALTGAKAKNAKAVQALLNRDAMKLNDDGSILGLNEQLEAIKKDNDYLFADTKEPPKFSAGAKSKSVGEVPGMAAWKAAGFKDGPPET